MILIILFLLLFYSIHNKYNIISLLLFFILLIIIKKQNLIEPFNTDKLRFIPCSDNTDNIMNNNYQLQVIKDIGKENDILYKLYSDDIDNMFKFKDCNIDPDYNFDKSYIGYFDRKIYSIDSIDQKNIDNHNKFKDHLLYNDPFLFRHPHDLETKIIYDFDDKFKKDFESYLDNNNNIHNSFNRGLKYTTCEDIDNNGNKYHCPYPYIFNFKNKNVLCTQNNEYCNNICCTSP